MSTQAGAVLRIQYGSPRHYADTAAALRLVGKRNEIHPRDAHAFVYPSQEAADAFATANVEGHDIDTWHTALDSGEVLGVLDLRRSLKRLGNTITDPSLPDNWRPPAHEQ